jgi:hypothetical protein
MNKETGTARNICFGAHASARYPEWLKQTIKIGRGVPARGIKARV